MTEVVMKIFFSIIIGLLFISCKESNVNPVPDPEPEPCEVPIFGTFEHLSKGYVPLSISNDNKILTYRSTLDTFKIVYFQNLTTSEIYTISDENFNQYLSEFQSAIPSPYDLNEFLIVHKFRNDSIRASDSIKVFFNTRRLYLFNFLSKKITEVTPVKFLNYGVPIQLNPLVWLNNSTKNNDWIDCGNGGILQLQTGEITPEARQFSSVYTKSNDGSIIVKLNSNDSMVTLNEVPIIHRINSSGFKIDKDNKYLSCLRFSTIDSVNTFQNFWKLYIVDIQKSLNANKVEFVKIIDLKNDLCAFQTRDLITLNAKNSLVLPLSRYSIQEKSNLYEIDFNGKILRQLTNE